MSKTTITIDTPNETQKRIDLGEWFREGSVVRNREGQIMEFIPEAEPDDDSEDSFKVDEITAAGNNTRMTDTLIGAVVGAGVMAAVYGIAKRICKWRTEKSRESQIQALRDNNTIVDYEKYKNRQNQNVAASALEVGGVG